MAVGASGWRGPAMNSDPGTPGPSVFTIPSHVPFVDALQVAPRRRVIIALWAVPPPARNATLFRLVFGEDQIAAPGHRELLPVLWLGLLSRKRSYKQFHSSNLSWTNSTLQLMSFRRVGRSHLILWRVWEPPLQVASVIKWF